MYEFSFHGILYFEISDMYKNPQSSHNIVLEASLLF